MKNLTVFLLCQGVDLGVEVHKVSVDEAKLNAMAEEYNKRDRISWVGGDGKTYHNSDKWQVFAYEVEDLNSFKE